MVMASSIKPKKKVAVTVPKPPKSPTPAITQSTPTRVPKLVQPKARMMSSDKSRIGKVYKTY
jgi:hypothetical protein